VHQKIHLAQLHVITTKSKNLTEQLYCLQQKIHQYLRLIKIIIGSKITIKTQHMLHCISSTKNENGSQWHTVCAKNDISINFFTKNLKIF